MSSNGRQELLALRDQLNASIDSLLADSSLNIPSLKDTHPGPPLVTGAAADAATAAAKLEALLAGPVYTISKALGGHIASSLRVSIEAHVVETIREAGGHGVHVREIAKSSEIDPAKLARILRLLAAHHIFIETEVDTFANSRCSIVLDTGKSVEQLKSDQFPYADTNGFAALIAHSTDDVLKATAFLSEAVLSPNTAHSYAPTTTAWALANRVELSAWEFFAQPENEQLLARFGMAMIGVNTLGGGLSDVLLPGGFDFTALPKDAVLVDVGGGAGAVSLLLAEKAPQLKIVLQDRPEVIKGEAQKVWEKENPSAIASGQVQLTAHDFFSPQPVKGADVYLMRFILHDWADAQASEILQHLSSAASPDSTLVVIEHLIHPLSSSSSSGATLPYLTDLQMMTALNALERTEEQYRELGKKNGWKLVKVADANEGGWCHLIFEQA